MYSGLFKDAEIEFEEKMKILPTIRGTVIELFTKNSFVCVMKLKEYDNRWIYWFSDRKINTLALIPGKCVTLRVLPFSDNDEQSLYVVSLIESHLIYTDIDNRFWERHTTGDEI